MNVIKKENLLLNFPIELDNNLGTIYQPILRDFIENNFELERMIRAFGLKKELVLGNGDTSDIKNFDIFLLQLMVSEKLKNESLINDLVKSLQILYKTDNIKTEIDTSKIDYENFNIIINDEVILNRNNYDYMCSVIMVMLDLEENDKEQIEALSDIQLKFLKRRQEWEAKHGKKDSEEKITIFDLVNFILHADGTIYTYESILNLTIYQIKNTFNLYKQKENYTTDLKYRSSGNFKMEDKLEHWFFNKERLNKK